MAAINQWLGGTGDWSNPVDWSTGMVPGAGDLAIDQNGSIVATNVQIGSTVLLDASQSGTVGLSLVSTILDPGSALVTNAGNSSIAVKLDNSVLEGTVLASGGSTQLSVSSGAFALNTGWIEVAGASTSADLSAGNSGAFANAGVMEAGNHGNLTLGFGAASFGSPGDIPYTVNFGLIQADTGGSTLLQEFGPNAPLVNAGQISAAGGEIAVEAGVTQLPSGTISVTDDGTLLLAGNVAGGTIQIQSGMLDYSAAGTVQGEPGATGLTATVAFTGPSADLRFLGEPSVQDTFDAALNTLAVMNPAGTTIVDIQLASNRVYSAANFQTSRATIAYIAQPQS